MELEALTVLDPEFHEVVKLCGIPFDPEAADPLVIEKIRNPRLTAAFNARLAAIAAASKKKPEEVEVRFPLFHGTTEEAAKAIAATGFDATKSCVAAFNKGTYFAVDPNFSLGGYAKQDAANHQFLFVCRVIIGRSCIGTNQGITDTKKYDSAGDGSTIVSTPYSDGAIPVYYIRWAAKFPPIGLPPKSKPKEPAFTFPKGISVKPKVRA